MAGDPQDSTEIKDTDIVFDCPHCGKSLAIDYRGAGLTIPCTDCGRKVEVPIPEGMEITDIDSTDEEQEMRILNLRRSLSSAEYRIEQLESELQELRSRRALLEREHAAGVSCRTRTVGKLAELRAALKAAGDGVDQIATEFNED